MNSAASSSTDRPGQRSPEPGRVADKVPPRALLPFFRQFGGPEGLLGRLALRSMAKRNLPVNEWVATVAAVGTDDCVLDVGCGPGVGLGIVAGRAASVAGVDVTPLAVATARTRNPDAVVECAPADALPFPDGAFTVVVSVNSMGFWPDPEAGVREIHRVLDTGGRIVVALRMKVDGVKRTDRRAYGSTPDQIALVERLFAQVGFTDVRSHESEPGGELTTAVVGIRS